MQRPRSPRVLVGNSQVVRLGVLLGTSVAESAAQRKIKLRVFSDDDRSFLTFILERADRILQQRSVLVIGSKRELESRTGYLLKREMLTSGGSNGTGEYSSAIPTPKRNCLVGGLVVRRFWIWIIDSLIIKNLYYY